MNAVEKKLRRYRKAALALAVVMIAEAALPTVSFALTSGPASPEFSSFEPVATTNMVNEYTGDFTYNLPVAEIPGAAGGGYALSLSYHSGASMEEEASWVGYGWTLNPGAINRNKRGFADDVNGDAVTYYNDVPANWTVGLSPSLGNPEIFSKDIPVSLTTGLRYNNYRGFSTTSSVGYNYKDGLVSLGYSRQDGDGSFSLKVNPAALLCRKDVELKKVRNSKEWRNADKTQKMVMEIDAATKDIKREAAYTKGMKSLARMLGRVSAAGSNYGIQALSEIVRPTSVTPYNSWSLNIDFSIEPDPGVIPAGPTYGIGGNYSQQKNVPVRQLNTYGYMYSKNAGQNAMMDYYVEKDAPYNKRDNYLSIPFSSTDQYAVSGEGLGGGFRMHSRQTGHFRPNYATSHTDIFQGSAEVHVGATTGFGFDVGVGTQDLTVSGNWVDNTTTHNGNTGNYAFGTASPENYFFRFSGDLGGDVQYAGTSSAGDDDQAVAASIYVDNGVPGFKAYHPSIDPALVGEDLTSSVDGINRSGSSSYIAYHTNSEMGSSYQSSTGVRYYAYCKDGTVNNSQVDRSSVPYGVGEIVTFNEEGNRYVYGLPVYARNETTMRYDLQGIPESDIHYNHTAYKTIDSPKMRVGEVHPKPYATSYLLTEITTTDYVDRGMDGLDENDFGGYTKFSYRQKYGSYDKAASSSNWYHWRIPYTGLTYDAADRTDNTDDMGSYMSGDKEMYYLEAIDTKTHLAVFVTNKTSFARSGITFNGQSTISGSNADRLDGMEAANDYTAGYSSTAQGSKRPEKLERIELYAKDASNNYKLIKTTYFEYDNSICDNTPNTTSGTNGKLTLKKVWFQYEGITPVRIAPYKFEYEYPSATTFPSKYSSLQNYGGFSSAEQNPNYSPFNLDCWGNFQKDGTTRHANLMQHVDQTPPSGFDPAAWQLKVIKLPSGGEIHVQYEQDDYLYVQDRRALALVSLHGVGSGSESNRYYLDVESDLGLSGTTDLNKMASLIYNEFQDKKIYFKFLYNLAGSATPTLADCHSDYVTGYVNVLTAGIQSGGTYNGKLYVELSSTGGNYMLPSHVCEDLVKTEKGGKMRPKENCDASENGIPEGSASDVFQQLLSKIANLPVWSGNCATVDPERSYFRIPMLHAKKGGGIRVKRLLMYDPGIESGDKALYGTEYSYVTADGESSGVASNEPSSNREENALVTFLLKRTNQQWWKKAISGRDKENFEGPIGESILPAPSVGYSRVVARNIHSGKTNTGFSVNEYYTTKDFPFDKQYATTHLTGPAVDQTDIEQEQDWLIVPAGFVNISITNLWRSQGYRFVLTEMDGKPKTMATYAGDYSSFNNPNNANNYTITSMQQYEYFDPGEDIPFMTSPGTITSGNPGKTVEYTMERRSVEDIATDFSLEMDFGAGLLPIPLPWGSAFPSYSYTESKMRTHVISKVITYPAIPKKVTTVQDGIAHVTENLAFNPYNGQPVLTRTTDGFDGLQNQQSPTGHDGSYRSYSISAASQYREMGQKAIGERFTVNPTGNLSAAVNSSSGNYTLDFTYSGSTQGYMCNILGAYSRGDLLKITGSSSTYFFHVDSLIGNSLSLLPAKTYNSSVGTIATVSSVEIVRSGRTNQLGVAAGGFTTYGAEQNPTGTWSNNTIYNDRLTLINKLNANLFSSTSTSFTDTVLTRPGTTGDCCETPSFVSTVSGSVVNCTLNCATMGIQQLPAGGTFALDPGDGTVIYYPKGNNCFPIKVTFINFCEDIENSTTWDVIASSAATFDHYWKYNTVQHTPTVSGSNLYELGQKGKWRVKETYAYRQNIQGGNWAGSTERNYKDAGVYPMVLFNWKNTSLNNTNRWLKANTVLGYTPNGEAMLEQDVLGTYSTAKFGYSGVLPYLVAANADTTVQFESFEKLYGTNKVEEGLTLATPAQRDATTGHTGTASYKLIAGSPSTAKFTMKQFPFTSQVQSKGLSVKVWVKDKGTLQIPVSGSVKDVTTLASQNISFQRVASTGEWSLYEGLVTSWSGYTLGNNLEVAVTTAYTSSNVIWIDDIRIQPYDAKVMCYVYDPKTLRLLASFDDQHFAQLFQYNAEGKLVRKLVETERGIKTLQESQYHTPLQTR